MSSEHNGTLYLSGGMENAKNLGGGWRSRTSGVLERLNFVPVDITALDVAYSKTHGNLFTSFGSADTNLLQMKSNIRKHFVHTDLQLIEHQCDGIILYYDESVRLGCGTLAEAQITFDLGKPIFVVNSYQDINELPGWLIALSTVVFNSFSEMYNYLKNLPPGIIKKDVYGNCGSGNNYLCSLCGHPFEKGGKRFVSKISPLYCMPCVDVVATTHEAHADRYDFFIEQLET